MKEPRWPAKIWSVPFFWRVFLLNGLVFVAGVGGLALSPATSAWPLQPAELDVLAAGLLVMIATNAVLLHLGLAPLGRLANMMRTVDLLRPGQRLPERGTGDLTPLVRAFNAMLDRLESERSASSAAALIAQEDERRRIARELHDEVGQGLTALLLELSQLSERAPRSLRQPLTQLLERTRDSLTDVRRIAQRLRPDVLEELGLSAALNALFSEFTDLTGLPVHRHGQVPPHLPRESELVIYRIAQESLTNVTRHADASKVEFSLDTSDHGDVRMTITDDGHGISAPEGGGIRGMRERALLVHADLEITSRPDGGTQLTLSIPSNDEERRGLDHATHQHPPR